MNIIAKNISISMVVFFFSLNFVFGSSHREAPLIADDPLADNVDLYAFRSPENQNTITIIATYVPFQLPHGGPNYYSFGENIRYEVHVDNDATIPGDEVTYRFTFNQVNEDPTTFFNIRLGAQNLKTTYTLERSIDGGQSFQVIIANGVVPPNNIGPRSIESAVGLNTTYDQLFQSAITDASTGEKVFAGPTDDPFFVDLAGIFDLGDASRQDGTPTDGLACYNVSAIAIQIPIETLLKEGAPTTPTSILDSDYVIGVWASSSRQAITTLSSTDNPSYEGDWIQVSRLGMPLTNEAVIPIGRKDFWNAITPYDEIGETTMDEYFFNPELALYMDDDLFGGAVPAFSGLRVQSNSLGSFDFTNGADGLYGLKGTDAVAGTALDEAVFGGLLLPDAGKPRSVDLWPAFHTGVPNVIPYQLATGKAGNPLAAGKPFVNNFLPNGGDMLRLNMAVPVTSRDDANFSSLGLVQAAAIGLTVPPFNTTADMEFIPNMDGFPNGRRLEDDVTRIELQAVAGVVLAAVGLWYDDYDAMTSPSPVTEDLLNVLTYTTGVENNDRAFSSSFPYLAMPFSGTGDCSGEIIEEEEVLEPESYDKFFVSSNTTQNVGVYSIDAGSVTSQSIRNVTSDADGIFYDTEKDLLYQLNRLNGAINIYENVENTISQNQQSLDYASSTQSLSINGREITMSGNRVIVAQDANDQNNNQNKLIVHEISDDGLSSTGLRRYDVTQNLWGIQAVGETIYAVIDNSNDLAIFKNPYGRRSGLLEPTRIVEIQNMVRTHGLHYVPNLDLMIMTDVGEASSDTDGALVIIPKFMDNSFDALISEDEQIRISGPNTMLGNPVDVTYDRNEDRIYIAERARNGGLVLGFEFPAVDGDASPFYMDSFAGASAIHLPNEEDGQQGETLNTLSQIFASSNTTRTVGVYNILEGNCVAEESFPGVAGEADGIYFDTDLDRLYQLNRFNNSINGYDNLNERLDNDLVPQATFQSSANFKNGREMTYFNEMLVVAQDANDENNQTNAFIVYDIVGNKGVLNRKLQTNINLWGIHAEAEVMYAIEDNTNRLAEFDNFFGTTSSSIMPSRSIEIEGIIRTHGLTYDAQSDIMFLTDIGDAASDTDGAFTVIHNYQTASGDGLVTLDEQIRVEGSVTELGNPVDISWDVDRQMIFIAERANGGGKILGFPMPMNSGNFNPAWKDNFAGASAVYVTGTISQKRAFARSESKPFNYDVIQDPYAAEFAKEFGVTTIDDKLENEEIKEDANFDMKVFPNPTSEMLYVKLNGDITDLDQSQIEVYTFDGRLVEALNTIRSHNMFDVSEYEAGLYYVKILIDEKPLVKKFIKL